MAENNSATKRLFKNTMILYFRQFFIMLVSLFTVRITLKVLGSQDYGIYNVVGGVVVLFSFISNAMSSSVQRYFNFYLGKKDLVKTNQVYSCSILIHVAISIVFIILAETIGLWFTLEKLNVPEERHFVVLIVYEFSIITTIFSILRVPYYALIIAYERMSFFAFLSVIEVVLKLLVSYLLFISPIDKLICYSILLSVVSLIITLIYYFYCKIKFNVARFSKIDDKSLLKEILSFSGWSLFGATADVANTQGTNVVLNLFTNVTVNAAMGIANQVNTAVYSFVSNFQTAFKPQIVKLYAEEGKENFIKLIYRTSRISFLLLSFISIPIILNTNFVLTLWLHEVPPYAVHFVQLIIVCSLISSWNGPLWMAIQATGNIRTYQLIISLLIFINLPLSIFALWIGLTPDSVLTIRAILLLITTIWRVFFLGKRISLRVGNFIFSVLGRTFVVFAISLCIPFFIGLLIKNSIIYFFVTSFISVVCVLLFSIVIGFEKSEVEYLKKYVKAKIKKNKFEK